MLVTNRLRSGELDNATYDYIVVGAGPAGCALAAGLSDDASCSVLLIEAGKHYGRLDQYPSLLQRAHEYSFSLAPGQRYPSKPRFSMFTWSYEGHLNEHLQARVVRGRVVGGSSAINGGAFTRGRPRDYDSWAAAGNPAWSFERVLPALRSVETDLDFGDTELHGARGPIRVQRVPDEYLGQRSRIFLEAAISAGFRWDPDMNGLSTGGVGRIPLNVVDGVRQNAGSVFVERVSARKNLLLLDQTTVRRVMLDKHTAVGVEIAHRGSVHRLHANETVLCASGINSPHLLMVSGIGPAETLKRVGIDPVHDLAGVGTDLADHPYVILPFTIPEPSGDGMPGGGLGLNYASGGDDEEDLTIVPYVTRPDAHLVSDPNNLGFLCGLSAPCSRGEIALRSNSPEQRPVVYYHYLADHEDRRRMRHCVRLAVELLEHPAYRSINARRTALNIDQLQDDIALDHWIATNLMTSYHSAGTCRMGPEEDETAVVDQYCRVRGIDGLRVVDASIVPIITTRGMHATAAMIGEHAVSLIRRRTQAVQQQRGPHGFKS